MRNRRFVPGENLLESRFLLDASQVPQVPTGPMQNIEPGPLGPKLGVEEPILYPSGPSIDLLAPPDNPPPDPGLC